MPDPTGRISHLPEMHRGVAWKEPVRVATTGSITIATALNAGDSIDGVTLAAGDRVLVKDNGNATNGIYVAGASPARAYDMDQDSTTSVPASEVMGACVYVIAGGTNGGKIFRNTNTSAPTLGVTTLTFTELTAAAATSFGTPALTLGTSNAAGAASTAIRTDATILAFDATAPVTQDYDDVADAGAATVAARRDHKHGMPSAGGGAAVEVLDEGSSLTSAVTSIDFVGAGVTATATGDAVTVTISGASVSEITDIPTAETDTSLVLAPDGAGGVEWVTPSAGPGGGGYPLDSYTLDGTYGDDFTGASLNTSLWTRRGYAAGDETYQLGKNGTYLGLVATARSAGDGYYTPAPAGDWTFAIKFIARGFPLPLGFGIRVCDSSGNGVDVNYYSGAGAGRFYLLGVSGYGAYTGVVGQEAADTYYGPNAMPLWYYLRKSGTTYYAAWSRDGEVWSKEISGTWAGTVDRLAFCNSVLGTVNATAGRWEIDWFNRLA